MPQPRQPSSPSPIEGTPLVRRRPVLPPLRAVVGALLVTVAVTATYALGRRPEPPPGAATVVVGADIAAGASIADDDLRVVTTDLPSDVARWTVTDPAELRGAVALRPLRRGEILDTRSVRPPSAPGSAAAAGFHEVTLPVRRDRTPPSLVPGDRVTLLAYDQVADALGVAAEDAVVLGVDDDPTGIGAAAETRITLGLTDAAAVLDAVRASHRPVTVVLTTRAVADRYDASSPGTVGAPGPTGGVGR